MSKFRVKMWEFFKPECATLISVKFLFVLWTIFNFTKLKKNEESNSYNKEVKEFSHFNVRGAGEFYVFVYFLLYIPVRKGNENYDNRYRIRWIDYRSRIGSIGTFGYMF